jgi:hypothetical protein
MKLSLKFMFALAALGLAGCGGGSRYERSAGLSSPSNAQTAADSKAGGGGGGAREDEPAQAALQNASLQQAEQSAPTPVERKIIRDATLALEVDEPSKAAQRVNSIAEARGGFVVSSESRQESRERGKAYEVYTVQLRVPAAQFDAALADIRAAGGAVTSEKVAGKDVTEEYIDLEARLRTQRALEAQLLDIMKGAHEVEDAISVHRELSNVRTEIERLEGRRRFLENQSSLSTISVTLRPPTPLVSTSGFFRSVGEAFGDGVDIAAAVTLFLIRALLALLPVALFLGVPAYFLLRFAVRRARRARAARAMAVPPPEMRPGGPAV